MHNLRMRDEEGSITLEAALVLPMFMLFVVFMASMIRISVAEIGLNKAVSETTEIIATHAYPATILSDGAKSYAKKKVPGISSDLINLDDLEEFAQTTIQDVFDIDISASSFISDLAGNALQGYVGDKYKDNVDSSSAPDITVDVDLPGSINGGADSYLGVTASMDMDLTVPFVDYTITLKKRAYERLWVGSR